MKRCGTVCSRTVAFPRALSKLVADGDYDRPDCAFVVATQSATRTTKRQLHSARRSDGFPVKSLGNPIDRADVLYRLHHVRADTPRQWGRMTAPQMICHLTDAFRGIMGERPATSPPPVIPRWRQRLLKLVALQLPFAWPRGVKTRPDVDQEKGGTRPGDFATDVAELTRICERFATSDKVPAAHYLFGPLTLDQWRRWGYRHMDHHLRQFGL